MLPILITLVFSLISSAVKQNQPEILIPKKFIFNSDILNHWFKSPPHYTPNFTTRVTTELLSAKPSIKCDWNISFNIYKSALDQLKDPTNKDTPFTRWLIEESNVYYTVSYDLPMAAAHFVITFISEGYLVNTIDYVKYSYTFIYPIQDSLLINRVPNYDTYLSFYNSFNDDLINIGYSPKDTELMYYEIEKILNVVELESKNEVNSIDTSVNPFVFPYFYYPRG